MVQLLPPEQVFTSMIVLGELRRGIELVARRDRPQAEFLERWYAEMREGSTRACSPSTSPS